MAVTPDGEFSIRGALTLSTPIAYSLRGNRFSLTLGNTSYNREFQFFSRAKRHDFGFESNGTAVLLGGFSTKHGDFSAGTMIASGALENVWNIVFSPAGQRGQTRLAVGAQGLFVAGGFLGKGLLPNSADRSTSLFAVATTPVGRTGYLSVGAGTSRFAKGFASASFMVAPGVRVMTEHDGKGLNYGIGFEVGSAKIGRGQKKATAFIGLVEGKYAFWSMSFGL